MTREEAISFLQNRVDLIDNYYPDIKDYREALVMAIKALGQEPCEDCVSRRTVLKTLDTADKFLDEDRTVEHYKAFLKECYKVLPPVTPTRKKGKWTEIKSTEYKEFSVTDMKCNRCNRYASTVLPHGTTCTYDFCPNCGAEMQEVTE